MVPLTTDLTSLHKEFARLRGPTDRAPDASIIVPVNAEVDLQRVHALLGDIARYRGKYALEIILVINNYPSKSPPTEINELRDTGARIVAVPSARRQGEFVIMSARALGVQAAASEVTIHTDADCRIPNVDGLVDEAVDSLKSGAGVWYGRVDYYELPRDLRVHVKMAVHHAARWAKRNLFGIPTTQGANYSVSRSLFNDLYNAGKLCVELQVGPAARLSGARVVYSGALRATVLASGRTIRPGWRRMLKYFVYRLRYNIRAIPTRRRDVARASWDGFDKESDNREGRVVSTEI